MREEKPIEFNELAQGQGHQVGSGGTRITSSRQRPARAHLNHFLSLGTELKENTFPSPVASREFSSVERKWKHSLEDGSTRREQLGSLSDTMRQGTPPPSQASLVSTLNKK